MNTYIQIITNISIQNKYLNWYLSIVNSAKLRTNLLSKENHHIVPECFFIDRNRKGNKGFLAGNSNGKDNFVQLTPKEHYVCHHLLTKMFNDTKLTVRMQQALAGFLMDKNGTRILTAAQYSYVKTLNQKTIQNKVANNEYHTQSEEWRKKMSVKYTAEGNPNYGKRYKRTQETVLNMSGENNGMFNKIRITNGIKNLSINKNEPIPVGFTVGVTCKKREYIFCLISTKKEYDSSNAKRLFPELFQ
jgi:hypothetical protein